MFGCPKNNPLSSAQRKSAELSFYNPQKKEESCNTKPENIVEGSILVNKSGAKKSPSNRRQTVFFGDVLHKILLIFQRGKIEGRKEGGETFGGREAGHKEGMVEGWELGHPLFLPRPFLPSLPFLYYPLFYHSLPALLSSAPSFTTFSLRYPPLLLSSSTPFTTLSLHFLFLFYPLPLPFLPSLSLSLLYYPHPLPLLTSSFTTSLLSYPAPSPQLPPSLHYYISTFFPLLPFPHYLPPLPARSSLPSIFPVRPLMADF